MKIKFGRIISRIGNTLTVFSILSVLAKNKTISDLKTTLVGLLSEVEQILQFFGRIANLIIKPWDKLIEGFFSWFPISVPTEWQSYGVLFTLSMHYPFIKFLNGLDIVFVKIEKKRLDAIDKLILDADYRGDDNYLKIRSTFEKLIISDEMFLLSLIGPVTEYLVAIRSDVTLESLDNVRIASKQYIYQMKSRLDERNYNNALKYPLWLFKISVTILILFVVDKLRLGFNWDFLIYATKSLVLILSAFLVPSIIFLLITILYLKLAQISGNAFKVLFPIQSKRFANKILNWVLSYKGNVHNDEKEFPNYRISMNGQKIIDISKYVQNTGNIRFRYNNIDVIPYKVTNERIQN